MSTGDIAVTSSEAPEPRGPYPHIRIDGNRAWLTGQIGREPITQEFVERGFENEFHQSITNLERILAEVGATLADVVHTCVQFVDEEDLDAMNRIYAERFPAP